MTVAFVMVLGLGIGKRNWKIYLIPLEMSA